MQREDKKTWWRGRGSRKEQLVPSHLGFTGQQLRDLKEVRLGKDWKVGALAYLGRV